MKTNNTNWIYWVKHCLSTLLLSPFMSEIIMLFNPNKTLSLLQVYPFVFIISLIFCLPTYAFYAFIYKNLSEKEISIIYAKVILITTSVIGIFITMYILMGDKWVDFALSYSLTSIITGLFFKLNFEDS
ncbi:hypothetical protein [Flavobacterium piscis]|uniref:Membrane-anchored protein n=1 Tax=Flavobacterium piscis TaxID=1114874 RepID=A0ABU1Y4D7_9FLAO|nr:hypothetical protein [Flavobacterium piscis]MDR7209092.1 putative membrane-anchored protein [Flavobacterium piscis]